jgi:hypothetical protein
VSAQTLHLAKTLAAIAADKKPRRLDADVQPPVRGMSHPGALYRRLALGVSQPLARMGPCCATVIRLPHSRPEPRVAAGRVNGPVCEVGGYVGQRPVLAQRPTHAPIAALAVAFENERALLGPNQHPDIHGRPRCCAPEGTWAAVAVKIEQRASRPPLRPSEAVLVILLNPNDGRFVNERWRGGSVARARTTAVSPVSPHSSASAVGAALLFGTEREQ